MARRGPPHGPRRPPSAPSQRYSAQFQVVKGGIEGHLDEYEAWPLSPFKLELEDAEIYQDVTGACLGELEDQGEIEYAMFDGNRYIVSPDVSSPLPDPEVREATNTLYDFISNRSNAYFAELVAYTALCKVFDELPVSMDVHPKGNYPWKMHGDEVELDALLEFHQERFPIEVYNGFQFVTDTHRKLGEMENLTIDEEPLCNTVLINRLSSPFSKEEAPQNGLIIDTRLVIACEENNPQLPDAVETLDIESHFAFIPKMETASGRRFDGSDWTGPPANYKNVKPSEMLPATEDLPETYLRRVRGGLQFQYVSTLFRRMSDPIDKVATNIIQDCYHYLLRQSDGTPRGDLIDIGWDSYRESHTRMKTDITRFEPDIKERARELLTRLLNDRIVIDRNGDLYARRADHPHASLEF